MQQDFFKDLQREILEIRDRYPHLTQDNAFVAWFMRAFITDDETQAVNSLTGKAGDKSSDAIYIDHDNRIVFIIQGKYHQNSSVIEPRSCIIALADLARALMSERKEVYEAVLHKSNPIVKQLLTETRKAIQQRNYQLVARFVTTGRISDTNIREGESRVEEFETARFETFSFKDLMKLMQDYIEGAAPPVPTISLNIQGTEVFNRIDKQTGITSWIFTMAANDVGRLFTDLGVRLFARNIRGYLGNTEINKVMKSTIENEPEYFWYYNNGITIVCDEARQIKKGSSNTVKVTSAQIINGQQTTRTLSLAGKSEAEVLVKLIEIPRDNNDKNNQYRHLVSEIVSATNWQNAISQSDLKSNDAEQVRIEKEFKKLNYFYIRKRMSKSEAVKYGADKFSFKINKEQLARASAACVLDPYEVRLGKDRLFEDDVYSKIFDGRKASEYLLFYWLYRDVEYWSKGTNKYAYAKWHVLNLLWSLLSSELKKNSHRDQFRLMAERRRFYVRELEPLNKIVKEAFRLSSAFYIANKKIDGKNQEPIDFFKHKDLHKSMRKFYEHSKKHKAAITKHTKALFESIQETAETR
jgi:hypothetical protein